MYQDKICVVIRGAEGVGRMAVEKLASEGAVVAFMDMEKEQGIKLRDRMIEKYGGEVFFFHGEAASEEDVEIFTGAVIGQFGQIDYLLNNVPAKAFMN